MGNGCNSISPLFVFASPVSAEQTMFLCSGGWGAAVSKMMVKHWGQFYEVMAKRRAEQT